MRGVRIVPRLPDIEFADTDVPRLWHSGSAGITAFWDTLTIAGPPIESFFLRDARRLAPLVKSAALRKEFADFLRQEAYHSRVHQRTYHLYEHWGTPVAALDAFVRRVLGWVERFSTTKLRSAMVVAGEHFLGEIGNQGLTNPALLEGAASRGSEWRTLGRHLFDSAGFWSGRTRSILAFLSPRFHPWRYRDDSHYLKLRSALVRPEMGGSGPPGRSPATASAHELSPVSP
jgi:predicted metal-dependent hydrolase